MSVHSPANSLWWVSPWCARRPNLLVMVALPRASGASPPSSTCQGKCHCHGQGAGPSKVGGESDEFDNEHDESDVPEAGSAGKEKKSPRGEGSQVVLPPGVTSLEEWGRTIIAHGREFKNLSYRTIATSKDSRHTRCPRVYVSMRVGG